MVTVIVNSPISCRGHLFLLHQHVIHIWLEVICPPWFHDANIPKSIWKRNGVLRPNGSQYEPTADPYILYDTYLFRAEQVSKPKHIWQRATRTPCTNSYMLHRAYFVCTVHNTSRHMMSPLMRASLFTCNKWPVYYLVQVVSHRCEGYVVRVVMNRRMYRTL